MSLCTLLTMSLSFICFTKKVVYKFPGISAPVESDIFGKINFLANCSACFHKKLPLKNTIFIKLKEKRHIYKAYMLIFLVHEESHICTCTTYHFLLFSAWGALKWQEGVSGSSMDTQKAPYHIFFRYEKRPSIRVFACIFLDLSVMSFPKFVTMTKNTPIFQILHVFAPLNDVCSYSIWSWKKNTNYVNFWTSLIPPLTF